MACWGEVRQKRKEEGKGVPSISTPFAYSSVAANGLDVIINDSIAFELLYLIPIYSFH